MVAEKGADLVLGRRAAVPTFARTGSATG
jgi:hypothetical protein